MWVNVFFHYDKVLTKTSETLSLVTVFRITPRIALIQKQSAGAVLYESRAEACNFVKKRGSDSFPMNFARFLKTLFSRTLPVAASVNMITIVTKSFITVDR